MHKTNFKPPFCNGDAEKGHTAGMHELLCPACKAKAASSGPNRTNTFSDAIRQKILATLQDHQWHTQMAIAELAEMKDGDNYVDVGRTLRSLRNNEAGHHPVDVRKIKGRLWEYKLLTPEEAEASKYWEKREARLLLFASADALRERVYDLEAELSDATKDAELERCLRTTEYKLLGQEIAAKDGTIAALRIEVAELTKLMDGLTSPAPK